VAYHHNSTLRDAGSTRCRREQRHLATYPRLYGDEPTSDMHFLLRAESVVCVASVFLLQIDVL
jgi:hypothetical protein